nr:uncharacterized protein LOC111414401 [Onthophagus taurus]
MHYKTVVFIFIVILPSFNNGLLQRCYVCRSRGELGSCKDTFVFKANDTGITSAPCASGWCGKMLETENAQKEDYDIATQRHCLQRGPSDNEERCAYTQYNHQRVFMCFCKGDLCNKGNHLDFSVILLVLGVFIHFINFNHI